MLLDRTQRKWMIAAAILVAIAAAIYIPYALNSPQGPRGDSAIGISFGIAGFALMIFAGLLGAPLQLKSDETKSAFLERARDAVVKLSH